MINHSLKSSTLIFFQNLSLLFILFSVSPVVGQISENNYRIYSVKLSKEVTLKDIAEDMQNYQVLFFGEEHNDSVAHYLENKMLETMHQKYSNNTALAMEMFDRDVQTVMNEYLKGGIREKNFTKDAGYGAITEITNPWLSFPKPMDWMLFVPTLKSLH
ncbi:MAG: ChaN family lipoprotein [Saprospiraceae bacterium]|nr:ChaN family lipoprotein [Candidatus Vicinibacter affinis]